MDENHDNGVKPGWRTTSGNWLRKEWVFVPLTLALFLAAWEAGVRLMPNLPAFILPPPSLVARRLWEVIQNGTLLTHTWVTLQEILAGLFLGGSAATLLGYVIAKNRTLERLLAPYIVASQSIPIVAIAPLLLIWFDSGMFSKILISALIVFFPILVNTVVGLRQVPEELRDLMRSLLATRWQTIRILELPAALPVLLGGLRVGATLSVIGAVVGEFVGADRGLGYLINRARGQYDTALVFAAVFTLVALALVLYSSVAVLERKLLAWREINQ